MVPIAEVFEYLTGLFDVLQKTPSLMIPCNHVSYDPNGAYLFYGCTGVLCIRPLYTSFIPFSMRDEAENLLVCVYLCVYIASVCVCVYCNLSARKILLI